MGRRLVHRMKIAQLKRKAQRGVGGGGGVVCCWWGGVTNQGNNGLKFFSSELVAM